MTHLAHGATRNKFNWEHVKMRLTLSEKTKNYSLLQQSLITRLALGGTRTEFNGENNF